MEFPCANNACNFLAYDGSQIHDFGTFCICFGWYGFSLADFRVQSKSKVKMKLNVKIQI